MRQIVIVLIVLFNSFSSLSQTEDGNELEKPSRWMFNALINYAPNAGTRDMIGGSQVLDLKGSVNYFMIRDYLSVGAAAALSRTYKPNINQLYFMGELKGYLSKDINAFYLFLNLGKSVPVGDLFYNGQSVGVGIGYRFKLLSNIFTVDLSGYNRTVQFDNKSFGTSDDTERVTGAFFGIGYQF